MAKGPALRVLPSERTEESPLHALRFVRACAHERMANRLLSAARRYAGYRGPAHHGAPRVSHDSVEQLYLDIRKALNYLDKNNIKWSEAGPSFSHG